jgi:hypothetical protein
MQSLSHCELRKLGGTMENFTAEFLTRRRGTGNRRRRNFSGPAPARKKERSTWLGGCLN